MIQNVHLKICKMGGEVTNLMIGDRVGIPWLNSSCGACEFCISGWETLCDHQSNSGFTVQGCFREYAVVAATHAVKIPARLTCEMAARKFNSEYSRYELLM
jgi:alcohol dehydrogenase, propanol-preferring